MPCSYSPTNIKNINLIEFLDCSICKKEVKYESIFCNSCQHWTHPECAGLTRKDLFDINNDFYGDWFCLPCSNSMFPLYPTFEDIHVENNEFCTFTDCSSCSQTVKGESMCCSLCSHWVHKNT